MNLGKFKIVSPRDVQSVDNVFEILLLNLDQIISVKPIKMVIEDKVANGFWIRTSNGKKYRAVEVPAVISDLLNSEDTESALTCAKGEDQIQAEMLN
jgi:hypothetical protein